MTSPLSRTVTPAYADTQGYLKITAAPDGAIGLIGKTLIEAGALTVAGAYECAIATDGVNVIEVELMPSAVTGSFAPSIKAMRYHQFASARTAMVSAGANFTAATTQVLTLTDLRGKKIVKVTFTIAAAGVVTFAVGANPASPAAIAEFNAL